MLARSTSYNNSVKNKLNILHIVQYDFYNFKGGIQRYVKELSEIQAFNGHNVTVYSCSKQPTTEEANGVTIKRFNYFEVFRTPISISMILSLLKEERFDIIHIHAQFPLVAELVSL
ncbi:MAG: glycosyltransferase, partial [Leptonema sp. (in: bacteria)]